MTMTMDKAESQGISWVFILFAAYFIANIAVRLLIPDSLGLDEAEQAFRSQWLGAGYGPQPPFYNWLQYTVFSLTGVSVLSLSVVKNLLLFTSYLLYGLTARRLLSDRSLMAIATLGLLTLPQIAFEMQRDLTHTVAALFAACVFLYGFILCLKSPSAGSYLVAGIGIGIGLLSKYNFALLPFAALLAVLPDREMRKRVFDWRLALTAGIALLIIVPHGFWLKDNLVFATARTLEKMTDSGHSSYPWQVLMGTGALLLAIVGFTAVTVVAFAVTFGKALPAAAMARSDWTRLFERMMLFFILGIMLLVVFSGAATVKDRWLVPLLFITPLYLCLKLEASGADTTHSLRRFLPIVAVVMIAVPGILFGRVAVSGLMHSYERQNISYAGLAAALSQQGQPGAIVAGDSLLAGNLHMQMPGMPVISLDYRGFKPHLSLSAERPLLLVWRLGDDKTEPVLPQNFADWLKSRSEIISLHEISTVDVPYHYAADGDAYRFAYAWIRPGIK
jgi:4-amino-4-deoxy-L-arabinose transferase-like glycosyltransferase